jgi:putative transposase
VSCRLLGVSRSGQYEWAANTPSERALTDAWLTERICAIHQAHGGVYGSPRIHADLRLAHGIRVARKRVEPLMREAGISGMLRRKHGRTTIQVPGVRVADDLVQRRFSPGAPNVLWVADVTYLRTLEGWLYLAAVQDAYSRAIVGWSMAKHMRAELVVDALQMAVRRRRPPAGLIHHSDQGSPQYTSIAFNQVLDDDAVLGSIGSVGDAYDNALAESFVDSFKTELIADRVWRTRNQLELAIVDYVAWFNTARLHESLGDIPPRRVRGSTRNDDSA